MGAPIAHGVHDGLRSRRRGPARRGSPLAAWTYFVVITICLSWLVAAMLGPPDPAPLAAAEYYAIVLAWPPLAGAWLASVLRGGGWTAYGWWAGTLDWLRERLGHAKALVIHVAAWAAWFGPMLVVADRPAQIAVTWLVLGGAAAGVAQLSRSRNVP